VRWSLILLILGTLLLTGLVVAAEPIKAPSRCTIKGTLARDVKTGTRRADVICTLAGRDFAHGRNGNDEIRGGRDRDVLVGGGGRDVLRGGGGPDRLFAVDDRGGEDLIGGPGMDQCFADRGDRVIGCERIFRSQEAEMATALGDSLGDVMEIVEEVEPTPTLPPPVVTVTQTITTTQTVSFPPCSSPPPVTPAPC